MSLNHTGVWRFHLILWIIKKISKEIKRNGECRYFLIFQINWLYWDSILYQFLRAIVILSNSFSFFFSCTSSFKFYINNCFSRVFLPFFLLFILPRRSQKVWPSLGMPFPAMSAAAASTMYTFAIRLSLGWTSSDRSMIFGMLLY